MSTGLIDYLKGIDGNVIYPITTIQSIYDGDTGKTLKEIIDGKLSTSGGVMTGNILYNMYGLQDEVSAWAGPFTVFDGGEYGLGVCFGGAGTTIIGSGESPQYKMEDVKADGSYNAESLHLTSDNHIFLYTKANTWANRNMITINTELNIYPDGDGKGTVGTSSNKFSAMYANTFNGLATSSKCLEKDDAHYPYANKLTYFNAGMSTGCTINVNDVPQAGWYHILRMSHSNPTGYYTDIAVPISIGLKNISYKCVQGGSIQTGNWITLLDSQNYTNYAAPKTHTHNYLSSNGGELSGSLKFNMGGHTQTAFDVYGTFEYGNNVCIRSGHGMIICSGESHNILKEDYGGAGSEEMVVGSDGVIDFVVNCDISANRVKVRLSKNRTFHPLNDKAGSIGGADYRWNSSYIWTQNTNRTNTISADYAELFEWEDGNTDLEDRRGYFVTFVDGDKIRIANSKDEYILGVVSGQPSIVGNHDLNEWQGKYVRDQFGTLQTDPNIDPETKDNLLINPEYDENMYYHTREERPEWDPIGMLGVIRVRDDGTCISGKYCTVDDYGRATRSDSPTGYRVLSRINDEVIKIVFR